MSEARAGYQRILVPVDFSPASAHSLAYALALGDPFAATVDALHVWRTNTETPVSVARERARDDLRAFVANIGSRGAAKLRRRTDYGDPFLTILRIAQLSSYDLIVAVAPRVGDTEHLGLALMQAARLPVLLVPSGWVEGRKEPDLKRHLRRILLPAVFAGRSPTAALKAYELAHAFDARLEALFVKGPTPAAEQERFASELERDAELRGRVEHRQVDEELEAALLGRVSEGGYDLLLLAGARGGVDQRGADPLLGRVLVTQRCPTLCERFD